MSFTESVGVWINSLMQFLFGWSINISPYFALFLITIVLTLISTLVYKYTTDQVRMKSIKEEMDGLRAKMKEHKGNIEKMNEINGKITTLSLEQMKHSVLNWKYMIITLVPLGLAFNWLKLTFSPMNLWSSPWGWFWAYLIFSLFVSQFVRKVLKVY